MRALLLVAILGLFGCGADRSAKTSFALTNHQSTAPVSLMLEAGVDRWLRISGPGGAHIAVVPPGDVCGGDGETHPQDVCVNDLSLCSPGPNVTLNPNEGILLNWDGAAYVWDDGSTCYATDTVGPDVELTAEFTWGLDVAGTPPRLENMRTEKKTFFLTHPATVQHFIGDE